MCVYTGTTYGWYSLSSVRKKYHSGLVPTSGTALIYPRWSYHLLHEDHTFGQNHFFIYMPNLISPNIKTMWKFCSKIQGASSLLTIHWYYPDHYYPILLYSQATRTLQRIEGVLCVKSPGGLLPSAGTGRRVPADAHAGGSGVLVSRLYLGQVFEWILQPRTRGESAFTRRKMRICTYFVLI